MGGLSGCRPSVKDGTGLPVTTVATIPLTGVAASYGEIQKRGMTLALQRVKGDAKQELLRVLYKDSQLSPREAVNALQQSIAYEKVQVVFSISTAEVLAQAPICNENKIVLLSPLASGDDITLAGPFVFRVSPSDSFQGRAIGQKIVSLKLKRIAVLSVNDSFGVELAKQFVVTM
ncbi:MAG: ABC transporter substrate-binding protein, partial [Bacteroidota bacterium]